MVIMWDGSKWWDVKKSMIVHELFLNWINETNYGDSPKIEHKICILLIKLENQTYHRTGINMESKKIHTYATKEENMPKYSTTWIPKE